MWQEECDTDTDDDDDDDDVANSQECNACVEAAKGRDGTAGPG